MAGKLIAQIKLVNKSSLKGLLLEIDIIYIL